MEPVKSCDELTVQEIARLLDALLARAHMQVQVEPGGPSHVKPRELQLVPLMTKQQPESFEA